MIAPQKDILEVQNAIKVYDQLQQFNPNSIKDLEKAHGVLNQSDNIGQSSPFIEWMLNIILQALENLLKNQNRSLRAEDRIELFKDKIEQQELSRKDYLQNFKEISQVTANRDLKWAVEQEILEKSGDKRLTKYQFH